MEHFINLLVINKTLKVLIVVIILDIIFGVLRAFKEKSTNSTIGINGMIRKSGMLISSIFLYLIDAILDLNFIGFLPDDLLSYIGLNTCGIGTLFGILYILFEFLSILKNMTLCELPIPKKLQDLLLKITQEMTQEIKKE